MGMGSGKTDQTIHYLKANPYRKIVVISLITALLVISFYPSIKDVGIPIEHYDIYFKTRQTVNKTSKHQMKSVYNLAICLNSLHYLKNNKFDDKSR